MLGVDPVSFEPVDVSKHVQKGSPAIGLLALVFSARAGKVPGKDIGPVLALVADLPEDDWLAISTAQAFEVR